MIFPLIHCMHVFFGELFMMVFLKGGSAAIWRAGDSLRHNVRSMKPPQDTLRNIAPSEGASGQYASFDRRLFYVAWKRKISFWTILGREGVAIEVTHIHQGRYDSEEYLINLRENSIRLNRTDILDAVNQRLKRCYPKIYQREVGPLQSRRRDLKFKCYCNNPQSGRQIFHQIINDTVPIDCLTCDSCWKLDLAFTWGYFGWATKAIPSSTWQALCNKRSLCKFVS